MKLKNKGKKIFPSPSSASSSASDVPSVLKLLPTAILALATVLSLEDREVLAYMITMSLKSTSSSTAASAAVPNKKPAKKSATTTTTTTTNSGGGGSGSSNPHKAPMFGCDCFDCYTSYWFRWDSSSNRELIHQAIEAFEEHLLSSEQKKSTATTSKKKKIRDKTARRFSPSDDKNQLLPVPSPAADEAEPAPPLPISPPHPAVEAEIHDGGVEEVDDEDEEKKAVVLSSPAASYCGGGGGVGRKGIVRKVLPDVLGLLNSRLWSLWGPNL